MRFSYQCYVKFSVGTSNLLRSSVKCWSRKACAWYFWYFLFWGWNFLKSWSIRAAACNGDLLVDRCAVFLEVSPDSVVRNRACRAVHWVSASSRSRVHDNSDQSVQLRGIMRRRACFWIRRRTCNFVPSKFHVREESIWILVEPLPCCFHPPRPPFFPSCLCMIFLIFFVLRLKFPQKLIDSSSRMQWRFACRSMRSFSRGIPW